MPRAPSSSKALSAILPLIASNQPYEAHQKARTFASRYVKANQHSTAIDVLFQSARELFKLGQQGSGTDLAVFLLEVYDSANISVDDESRGRITQLLALVGPGGSWRKTIIDKSIAWSAKHGAHPAGDPDLLHYISEILHKEGAFDRAEPLLLASGSRDSARLLAEIMAEWCGTKNDPGPFALRGTIPYLLNGNILAARTFIAQFTSYLLNSHPNLAISPPLPVTETTTVHLTSDPLVNFAQLAVLTCQRAQGDKNKAMREAWVRLCGTYQSKGGVLARPEVRQALIEIAQLYFAIPPPRNQPANPLGAMLSSFLGGAPGAGAPARRVLSPTAAGPGPALD